MAASGSSWKPGQSGNPGGRPKADHRIKDLAKDYTDIALRTLAEIAEHGDNEGARVSAAVALLDRGWGKPAQSIIGGEEDAPPLFLKIERVIIDPADSGSQSL